MALFQAFHLLLLWPPELGTTRSLALTVLTSCKLNESERIASSNTLALIQTTARKHNNDWQCAHLIVSGGPFLAGRRYISLDGQCSLIAHCGWMGLQTTSTATCIIQVVCSNFTVVTHITNVLSATIQTTSKWASWRTKSHHSSEASISAFSSGNSSAAKRNWPKSAQIGLNCAESGARLSKSSYPSQSAKRVLAAIHMWKSIPEISLLIGQSGRNWRNCPTHWTHQLKQIDYRAVSSANICTISMTFQSIIDIINSIQWYTQTHIADHSKLLFSPPLKPNQLPATYAICKMRLVLVS